MTKMGLKGLPGGRRIEEYGVCPYCESDLVDHCHSENCEWLRCVNCKAFGPPERMVPKIRATSGGAEIG